MKKSLDYIDLIDLISLFNFTINCGNQSTMEIFLQVLYLINEVALFKINLLTIPMINVSLHQNSYHEKQDYYLSFLLRLPSD